jgi:transcriptional regulator with XRE-family HTH domain
MNIGKTIKDLRLKKGFNQGEFAEICGLSQPYLSLIEKGKKEPTLGLLKEIAQKLSIPTPILVFLSLDNNDVEESKKEAFSFLENTMKDVIAKVFLADTL